MSPYHQLDLHRPVHYCELLDFRFIRPPCGFARLFTVNTGFSLCEKEKKFIFLIFLFTIPHLGPDEREINHNLGYHPTPALSTKICQGIHTFFLTWPAGRSITTSVLPFFRTSFPIMEPGTGRPAVVIEPITGDPTVSGTFLTECVCRAYGVNFQG
jgi:hypothetical protein